MTKHNLSFAQLTVGGLTLNNIRSQLQKGSLSKVRRGVYTYEGSEGPLARHRRLIEATVPYADTENTFSHTSAAVLHGLPVRNSDLGKVTMTRLTSGHADASEVLRVRDTRIEVDEITVIDGLRVTTFARTVADQARTLPFEWGLIVVDAALRMGLTRSELETALKRQRRLHGRPKALQVAKVADPRSESPAESLSRARMHQLGLPIPELQAEFFDREGELLARSDFFWPEFGLVGEVDGKSKYEILLKPGRTPAEVLMAEKERENAIRDLGHWVIRWGWKEAWDKEEIAQRISTGIAVAQRRRSA